MKLDFMDGDVVMVCKHIYHKSPCHVVQNAKVLETEIRNGAKVSARLVPRGRLLREDGTILRSDFTITCASCLRSPEDRVDYVEQYWQGSALHVADFAKAGR